MKDVSLTNKTPRAPGLNQPIPGFAAAMAIIVVAAIAVVIVAVIYANNIKEQKRIQSELQSSQTAKPVPPLYSYVGIVSAKEDSTLIVTAQAANNGLAADKTLRVLIDKNTSITKLSVPRTVTPGLSAQEIQALFSRQASTFNEIKAGDGVTVTAGQDIRNSAEFTASRIDVREVK